MNKVEQITKNQIRTDLPEFRVGDTVKVNYKIKEGNKERIQAFEGLVMSIQGSGISKNFIVRKKSQGIGVERTFPMNTPLIDSIEVVRKGKVRQAKLGYIRKSSKTPKIKDVKKESPVVGDITMSISANALGLTNAATPIGLRVMKELQEDNQNEEIATDSMCMFLGMNTAGFQIIPATVIAVLVGAGASNPSEIILPTLIVTTLAFITAIITAVVLRNIWNKKEGK